MRGRTNVVARPNPIINGEVKEFIAAEDIQIGDFVQYKYNESPSSGLFVEDNVVGQLNSDVYVVAQKSSTRYGFSVFVKSGVLMTEKSNVTLVNISNVYKASKVNDTCIAFVCTKAETINYYSSQSNADNNRRTTETRQVPYIIFVEVFNEGNSYTLSMRELRITKYENEEDKLYRGCRPLDLFFDKIEDNVVFAVFFHEGVEVIGKKYNYPIAGSSLTGWPYCYKIKYGETLEYRSHQLSSLYGSMLQGYIIQVYSENVIKFALFTSSVFFGDSKLHRREFEEYNVDFGLEEKKYNPIIREMPDTYVKRDTFMDFPFILNNNLWGYDYNIMQGNDVINDNLPIEKSMMRDKTLKENTLLYLYSKQINIGGTWVIRYYLSIVRYDVNSNEVLQTNGIQCTRYEETAKKIAKGFLYELGNDSYILFYGTGYLLFSYYPNDMTFIIGEVGEQNTVEVFKGNFKAIGFAKTEAKEGEVVRVIVPPSV